MVESKNLKLKLGLCGLALTSFLALNARANTVHADTVNANNNQNAITWDADNDDSQVVSEEPQQEKPAQSVQTQAPAVQKQQVAQSAQPKQSAVQSAPVQSKAAQSVQKQTTVQSKQRQVAVSNVSSTVSASNRAERSTVRQSSVQTSTVNRVNVQSQRNNQLNANVKVSNVNSDAQMPVQTQVIAKLSNKAKTYAISIPTASQKDMPMTYSGYDMHVTADEYGKGWSYDGWIYNGQYYNFKDQNALETALGNSDVNVAKVATLNPEYTMNGTEFLTDTGITYNNHRLGVLIIPKFTELKQLTDYANGDRSDIRYQNNGFLSAYPAGFLPALAPTEMEWTGSQLTPNPDENWHMTYSYTAVPIDMNTGQTISGVSIDGTATKETNIQTYMLNQTDEYGGHSYMTPFSDTTVTGGTVSSDQNLVSPYIKPFLDLINSGKITPYQANGSPSNFNLPYNGDYGGQAGLFNHCNVEDSTLDGNGQNTTLHKFIDSTVIPYTQNLFYLTLKTREVNPNDARAKRIAQRVIHVNFPNGVKPASYNGIVDNNNNIVQTVTFTRSGTENLADGSVQWGSWQGNGTFSPVTLPDIPGYTMVTTN